MKVAEFKGIRIIVGEPYNEVEFMKKFNIPEILKHTSLEYKPSRKTYSKRKLYNKKGTKRFIFKKKGKIVGSADLYGIEEHKATIRYWIAKDYWGQGIATKAIKNLTKFCFTKMKLQRLDAYVFKNNIPSKKVLEKIGFVREGLLKKFDKKGDKLIDEYIYAIYNE